MRNTQGRVKNHAHGIQRLKATSNHMSSQSWMKSYVRYKPEFVIAVSSNCNGIPRLSAWPSWTDTINGHWDWGSRTSSADIAHSLNLWYLWKDDLLKWIHQQYLPYRKIRIFNICGCTHYCFVLQCVYIGRQLMKWIIQMHRFWVQRGNGFCHA